MYELGIEPDFLTANCTMDNPDKNAALLYAIGFGAFGLLVLVLLFMFVFANMMATKSPFTTEPTPIASPSATP